MRPGILHPDQFRQLKHSYHVVINCFTRKPIERNQLAMPEPQQVNKDPSAVTVTCHTSH